MANGPARTRPFGTYGIRAAIVFCALLALGATQAHGQTRDGLLNGAVIGAAVGAGSGIAFTHAVRDSELVASQYARGAIVFGAIGAGVGLGLDALLARHWQRAGPGIPRRLLIAPSLSRRTRSIVVKLRW